jgi:hypothetical protein
VALNKFTQVCEEIKQARRHHWNECSEFSEASYTQLVTVGNKVAHGLVEPNEARLRSQEVQGKLQPGWRSSWACTAALELAIFALLLHMHLTQEVLHIQRDGAEEQPCLMKQS